MSISINKSSEATTQLNHPISYLINSSTFEDFNSNSFCSPRAGSVTVIGKRIFSNSCVSPNTIEEASRFPIPIKSVNRIKRQNTQAKILLKKKQSKVKCHEQHTPPFPKPVPRLSLPKPRLRSLKKTTNPAKAISPPVTAATTQEKTEKSTARLSKIIRKSVKFEMKKKKKIEKQRIREKQKKFKKMLKLDERNSKIRIENSVKFKMEKFAPKTPWGVSDKKHLSEKLLRDIETQREFRRNYKTSPACSHRKTLGLSKFLEIAEECGFRARSSSIQEEAQVSQQKRPETSLKVKKYIRLQKNKRKENERNKIIEDIQKETRRLAGLKILEVNQHPAERKPKKSIKLEIRPKLPILTEDLNKIYEDKSSDFVFEPDSTLEKEISTFTEESEKLENSFFVKDSAALKIQYFFRKFLRKKKKTLQYDFEDTEVQNILNSWNGSDSKKLAEAKSKQLFSEKQLESLEKMRQKEIIDLIEVAKGLTEDQQIVNSLTQLIGNRYKNIAEMLQVSQSFTDQSQSLEGSKDLDKKHTKMNCSLPSEKSAHDTSATACSKRNPSGEGEKFQSQEEIVVYQELNLENKLGEESPRCGIDIFKRGYISLSSPISESSEDPCDSPKVGKTVTSEYIKEISESIISRTIIEILSLESSENTFRSIDKDFHTYIEQLLYNTPELILKEGLASPIKKDLMNFLTELRNNENFYNDVENCQVIPSNVFDTIDLARQAAVVNKEIKDSQKAHDRVIFDCCNQLLNDLRPYGTNGEPAPWDSSERKLKKREIEIQNIIIRLSSFIQRFTEVGAGKICDQSFCADSNEKDGEGLQNIREEKIGFLIIESIQENEGKWVKYGDQEAQTCIELADWVFDSVLCELIEIVN